MTKADIVTSISESTGMTKVDTAEVLNELLDSISSALGRGEKIELRGFGIFKGKQRKARVARNPKTGTKVNGPSKRVIKFKASSILLRKLNKNFTENEISANN